MYKSAVNTIKYIRHYILFLIYCNIYLTYITTIHLGTTYPYGGCWLLLSRRGSFTICALKKNKPKLYFKLLFSLLGYDFLIRWVFFSGSCKKTCLNGYSYLIYGPPLNASHLNWKHLQWNNPKLINWLQVSSGVIHEMYLIETKILNSFLWYNGERVRIFYPNMTQVHILLNKVPYAVKCN